MKRDDGTDAPAKKEPSFIESIVPWQLDVAQTGESCRWVCVDGRWVSVSLGQGEEVGSVRVKSSTGKSELVNSYEGALKLAKSWRTWGR